MGNYYLRGETINSDGTPLFAIDYDKSNEDEVRSALEKAWKCEIKPFGRLCPIDYYSTRDGRMVGLLELKSRTHESTKYATVFLNVRKWIALLMGQNGLGVPAVFVVKFIDGIFYISVGDVDASKTKIGGTSKIVKSGSDIEPVIEVPISSMKRIHIGI